MPTCWGSGELGGGFFCKGIYWANVRVLKRLNENIFVNFGSTSLKKVLPAQHREGTVGLTNEVNR